MLTSGLAYKHWSSLHHSMCTAHTRCSHTCRGYFVVNKTLQCSKQYFLHSDATHRKHVPQITPSSPGKEAYLPFQTHCKVSERNVDWQRKVTVTSQPTHKKLASLLEEEHDIQLIINLHVSCARSVHHRLGYSESHTLEQCLFLQWKQ